MTYVAYIVAAAAPPPDPLGCIFSDTFTDADGTGLTAHTPDETTAAWEWQSATDLAITGNALVFTGESPDTFGYGDLYPDAFGDELPLPFPYRISLTARHSPTEPMAAFTGFVLQDDTGTDDAVFLYFQQAVSDYEAVAEVQVAGVVYDSRVTLPSDAEADISVLVEANRFTLTVNGVDETPVACTPQNTFTYAQVNVADGASHINTVSICLPYLKLVAPTPADSERLGSSLAISSDGNTIALGAPFGIVSGTGRGRVEVYVRSGGVFVHQATIQASDAATNDLFGNSIALSADGDTLAVGASNDTNSRGSQAGSVYVYTRSGTSWSEQARLQTSDGASSDRFGFSVALSADGNTLAGGAHTDNNSNGTDAGSAYVFTRSGSTWSQQARVQASDGQASDLFGWAVALSADGDTMAVGMNSDTAAGSAYVFTRSGTTWSEQAVLGASDGSATDRFGYDVALSDDAATLAVGCRARSSSAGAAYIFAYSGSWSEQAIVTATGAAASDFFGTSVALSSDGDTLATGAPGDDHAGGSDAGSAYTHTRAGSTWSQQSALTAYDAAAADALGTAVAISGDGLTVVAGTPLDNHAFTDAGSAYVFE